MQLIKVWNNIRVISSMKLEKSDLSVSAQELSLKSICQPCRAHESTISANRTHAYVGNLEFNVNWVPFS